MDQLREIFEFWDCAFGIYILNILRMDNLESEDLILWTPFTVYMFKGCLPPFHSRLMLSTVIIYPTNSYPIQFTIYKRIRSPKEANMFLQLGYKTTASLYLPSYSKDPLAYKGNIGTHEHRMEVLRSCFHRWIAVFDLFGVGVYNCQYGTYGKNRDV